MANEYEKMIQRNINNEEQFIRDRAILLTLQQRVEAIERMLFKRGDEDELR